MHLKVLYSRDGEKLKMTEFKLVIGTKSGKSHQIELKSPQADNLLKKRLGDNVKGEELGFNGYEFEISGGSDKCGFPMRKGIQLARKEVLIGGDRVGFSGRKRYLGKKKTVRKQKGLLKRRTVCGEMITKIIHQINLKVIKEGSSKIGEEAAPVEEKTAEAKVETPKEEAKPEEKQEQAPEVAEQ